MALCATIRTARIERSNVPKTGPTGATRSPRGIPLSPEPAVGTSTHCVATTRSPAEPEFAVPLERNHSQTTAIRQPRSPSCAGSTALPDRPVGGDGARPPPHGRPAGSRARRVTQEPYAAAMSGRRALTRQDDAQAATPGKRCQAGSKLAARARTGSCRNCRNLPRRSPALHQQVQYSRTARRRAALLRVVHLGATQTLVYRITTRTRLPVLTRSISSLKGSIPA